MSKFEVGHWVKCLTTSATGAFRKGNTYIVKSVDESMLRVETDEMGESNAWWIEHFQPYNGAPEQKQTGGIKHDADKVDFALVPVHSLTEVAHVWTFGKKKYSAWNWKNGFIWSRPYAAALRHIYAWARGEDLDPETGLPHLAHAICCLQMLIEFGHTKTGEDDRQKEAKPTSFMGMDVIVDDTLPAGTFKIQHPTPGQFLKRTSNKGQE